MKVFCIFDANQNLVSAWPKLGVAKIHCRKELKDQVVEGYCLVIEKPSKCAKKAKAKRGK